MEYICDRLVEILEDESMIHRGLNTEGKPVGYTIDSFSADRTVIAEYSTEAGYFEDPFEKPIRDCHHALAQAPNCKKVYLFSNRLCPPSVWQAVVPAVRQALGQHSVREYIYDSCRIAEDLYDRVIRENNLVEFFLDHLPSLGKVWAEHLVSHATPTLTRDYVRDSDRAAIVAEAIAKHPRVAIHGISGTGKTLAMVEYAAASIKLYSNIIWIGGDDLAAAANAKVVRVQRLGVEFNLEFQLKSAPCLLVIDDWRLDASLLASKLPNDLHPETKIALTCIQSPGKSFEEIAGFTALQLPPLALSSAHAILSHRLLTQPTEEQSATIIERTGAHPLCLAVIRDTVAEYNFSWSQITDDLDKLPELEGRGHQTILQRILLNHCEGIEAELCMLRWMNYRSIDVTVAMEILRTPGFAKVIKRSIVQVDSRGMCRMHDLMFECIRHYGGDNLSDESARQRLVAFFEKNWEQDSFHFRRALQMHADFIAASVDQDAPKPGLFEYLLLLAESLPASEGFIDKLRQYPISTVSRNRAAVLSIIEAIERAGRDASPERRQKLADKGIENISGGITLATESRIRSDLFHHRGKLYRGRKEFEKALEDFAKALQETPDAHHVHLQIARMKAKRREDSAGHIHKILSVFADDTLAVSMTTALAAFSELANDANASIRDEWLKERLSVLAAAISLATVEGFSQPYRTLGQLSRFLWYEKPESLISMAQTVTFPEAKDSQKWERFEIAECLKNVGKAHAEVNDSAAERSWIERSLEYYEDDNNEYHQVMKAEALIRLGRSEDALAALDACGQVSNGPLWWYRRSQALLIDNRPQEALKAAEVAINNDKLNARYASAYLQAKARAEAALNSPTSLATLKEAVAKADGTKFRIALEAEFQRVSRRFP